MWDFLLWHLWFQWGQFAASMIHLAVFIGLFLVVFVIGALYQKGLQCWKSISKR